jgi:hypothetical protein
VVTRALKRLRTRRAALKKTLCRSGTRRQAEHCRDQHRSADASKLAEHFATRQLRNSWRRLRVVFSQFSLCQLIERQCEQLFAAARFVAHLKRRHDLICAIAALKKLYHSGRRLIEQMDPVLRRVVGENLIVERMTKYSLAY